jgi:plasmid stabilization system protein ParE
LKIEWSPLAIQRVSEIADYISLDNPRAAVAWVDCVFDEVQRLSSFPESGRQVPEVNRIDIRELIYGNYRIIYRVSPATVSVLTVRHGKQLLPVEEVSEP